MYGDGLRVGVLRAGFRGPGGYENRLTGFALHDPQQGKGGRRKKKASPKLKAGVWALPTIFVKLSLLEVRVFLFLLRI